MAVMYSKLAGCLEDTAKLGPLARTDFCTWVKGLLDRLMTHLGLGSSKEDPWESLLGGMGWVPSWGLVLLAWAVALFPWEAFGALHQAEHLTAWLPACLPELRGYWQPGKDLPCRSAMRGDNGFLGSSALPCLPACLPEKNLSHFLPGKKGYWGSCADCLGSSAVPRKVGTCLPACLGSCSTASFLGGCAEGSSTVPRKVGNCLPGEATKLLPSQGTALTAREVALSLGGLEPACLPDKKWLIM